MHIHFKLGHWLYLLPASLSCISHSLLGTVTAEHPQILQVAKLASTTVAVSLAGDDVLSWLHWSHDLAFKTSIDRERSPISQNLRVRVAVRPKTPELERLSINVDGCTCDIAV